MTRTKSTQNKRRRFSVNLKKNRGKCLGNLIEAKRIISLLSSGKMTCDEEFQRLGTLSMLLMNIESRINFPSIPIESLLNKLKFDLTVVKHLFLNLIKFAEKLNNPKCDFNTLDDISRFIYNLNEYISTIDNEINKIKLKFKIIDEILEEISDNSDERFALSLSLSIKSFQKMFDTFVGIYLSKKERALHFMNSAKEKIEFLNSIFATETRVNCNIRDSSQLGSSSQVRIVIQNLEKLHVQLKKIQNTKNVSIESLKLHIKEYLDLKSSIQQECPDLSNIPSMFIKILQEISLISLMNLVSRQSQSSRTRRTCEQNLFDSRIKKGLTMVNACILNQNTEGLRKVCAYLTVLLKRCYENLP
jgi:hypothetical protein